MWVEQKPAGNRTIKERLEHHALYDAGNANTETKEVVGGYWMIQVTSRAEAIEWAKRAPLLDGGMIEIRQVQELSDSPPDVQKAAGR